MANSFLKFGLAALLSLSTLTALADDYLFSYTVALKDDKGGLGYALSKDCSTWQYASWANRTFLDGAYVYKGKMTLKDVFLHKASNGTWHLLWALTDYKNAIGHSESEGSDNLVNWLRKTYPEFDVDSEILAPIAYLARNGESVVEFKTAAGNYFRTKTRDFKKFSPLKKISGKDYTFNFKKLVRTFTIDGKSYSGSVNKISDEELAILRADGKWHKVAPWSKISQSAKKDIARYAGIESANVQIKAIPSEQKQISDMLLGIFFEDLNYAADGGLYAELIQNRDFEYNADDAWGWNALSFWRFEGDGTCEVKSENPIHKNNKNYVFISANKTGASIANFGYGEAKKDGIYEGGIVVKKGEKYDLSLFVKGTVKQLKASLIDASGKVLAQTFLKVESKDWKRESSVMQVTADSNNARLELALQSVGEISLDMVSLFPQKTFKNRKNGLRADLAQVLADLKPRFVRYPGGCLVHALAGDKMNFYHWKDSIGALEQRKPIPNCWGYHQSRGFGYYEFFQFCEDIGAEPLPIVAAGVGCQNPGQKAIKMDEMQAYTQDILDLIEYANGDAKKTKWGKIRAESGHPAPFNLKYIGIGNEDLISDQFEERFAYIYKAVKKQYPQIKVVGTSGPFAEGTDYREGWNVAKKYKIDLVDEHYYVGPAWLLANQHYYDDYDRTGPKVYLGEYAAHTEGLVNNMETAISCAAYLANLERNGDVVEMSSYAPLLAKEKYTRWRPDLIYFDNENINLTTDYYVQKLFGNNAGTLYIPSSIDIDNSAEGVSERIVCSIVVDKNGKGDIIVKLVNALPFKVNADINLPMITKLTEVEKTVFAGQYDSQNAKPIESKTKLGGNFKETLPPYSLTILRFKK